MTGPPPASHRAIELDAIRGLAILLAMGWHLNIVTHVLPLDLLLAPGRCFGWVGVDIFFVLSGFLIGGLIIREVDGAGGFRRGRFLIRRAFRLWPVLYINLIAHLIEGRNPAMSYVPQILLHVQNYFRTPIDHLWSLAVEEQFYLFAAMLLPVIARRRLATGTLLWGLGLLALVSCLLRTAMWFAGVEQVQLQWQTQYRIDVLLVGMLLAVLKHRCGEHYSALQRRRWIFAGLALVAVGGLVAQSANQDLLGFVGLPLGTLLGASLILALDGVHMGRIAHAVARGFAFMGVYSYAIYIWHPGIGRAITGKVAMVTGSPALGVMAAYAGVIALAVAITRLVERPMLKARDRLFPSIRL